MENCERHNCSRKPAQSLSFHESWDRTLPNSSKSKDSAENSSTIQNEQKETINQVEESIENPFKSDGELSKIADYIMEHSTICRTSVNIADPDESRVSEIPATSVEEPALQAAQHLVQQSAPKASPQQVEVKLLKIESNDGPQSAERLPPKGKCCSLQ
ncbi:DgyrCDS8433 [Dimorphilus gyrociliatus]|nr:DgyrCDS8433 [Dimorphilus gyrociliatus]